MIRAGIEHERGHVAGDEEILVAIRDAERVKPLERVLGDPFTFDRELKELFCVTASPAGCLVAEILIDFEPFFPMLRVCHRDIGDRLVLAESVFEIALRLSPGDTRALFRLEPMGVVCRDEDA
ncbi:MAG TPA: hypothetical protein VFG04_08985 [Planctomycetaceae bacterium]|nr:hypothetical protein [Planctomycetaceae bacterium]